MAISSQAPPVYRPNSSRVTAPPVYRPQTQAAQPKQSNAFKLENRSAPPVYRPHALGSAAPPQMKTIPPPSQATNQLQAKPAVGKSVAAFQQGLKQNAPRVPAPVHGTTIQGKSKAYDLAERDRPIELGGTFDGRLFLFKGGEGRSKLLISAHGAHKPDTRPATIPVPPGMIIHFYGIHGNVVQDPGLVLPPDPHVTREHGEEVANYTLTKYQGRHSGANETYQDIVLAVHGHDFDVLTMRHRFYGKEMTLQNILGAIAGRGYTDIYLNACQYVEVFSEEGLEMRHKDLNKLGYEQLE